MPDKAPRVVMVTRPSEYELLLARHATRSQAKFFLERRGRDIDAVEEHHRRFERALAEVTAAIPLDWRRSRVTRDALDRFLFEPADTVVVVGQDGLVANVAKYLDGQPVLGINPDPSRNDGVLVPLPPEVAGEAMVAAAHGRANTQSRTMAVATLDDGQSLVALNEIFIGHHSHQSARYRLGSRGRSEHQSSSGILVTTGTGATGWARSVCLSRSTAVALPTPAERRLAFFVREAFPGSSTATTLIDGELGAGESLTVVSEMNEGGVVFGDGIESDHLAFEWGMELDVRVSGKTLQLVQP